MRNYSELILLPTFEERLKYLQIGGTVGYETFGSHRYLNQRLYKTSRWRHVRNEVILRDSDGDVTFDLACPDHPFIDKVYIHHIVPITIEDIMRNDQKVYDLENLICASFKTHQAIHYGCDISDTGKVIVREKNDTCPWKGV